MSQDIADTRTYGNVGSGVLHFGLVGVGALRVNGELALRYALGCPFGRSSGWRPPTGVMMPSASRAGP